MLVNILEKNLEQMYNYFGDKYDYKREVDYIK